jgi:hypothetical protein
LSARQILDRDLLDRTSEHLPTNITTVFRALFSNVDGHSDRSHGVFAICAYATSCRVS